MTIRTSFPSIRTEASSSAAPRVECRLSTSALKAAAGSGTSSGAGSISSGVKPTKRGAGDSSAFREDEERDGDDKSVSGDAGTEGATDRGTS